MVILYGLKTCDTCRAARQYLDERDFRHEFRDVRDDGFSDAELDAWLAAAGWEKLVNKSSRTWRELSDADKADLDEKKAIALMLAQPSMIKRPVLDIGSKILVGFKPDVYEAAFA